MLQSCFKNYDEFKELFVAQSADGTKRRKNGILLSYIKSREFLSFLKDTYGGKPWEIVSMGDLYTYMKYIVRRESRKFYYSTVRTYPIRIMGDVYYSNIYSVDGEDGICVDGDYSGYRYKNMERGGKVYKMKVGKMFRHIIDLTRLKDIMPERIKLYVCEEITREWEAFTMNAIPNGLELHIDDNFEGIYSRSGCGNLYFHSCMQGDCRDNWKFYRDAVKAHAAYLTVEGVIVSRCIIFDEVTREDTGEVIRVAERQYSRPRRDNDDYSDEVLQRALILKLLDGGHIDAYKKTGAGCGEATAFLDKDGNDLSYVNMHIACDLHDNDCLSYQDSFKWYDEFQGIAYNYRPKVDDYACLDSTGARYCSYIEEEDDRPYSSYHEEHIDEDEAVWVETREDYFYDNETVFAFVYNDNDDHYYQENCFEYDCLEIDGEYYYAGDGAMNPGRYGIVECPYCGAWFVPGRGDSCCSEITEEDYCNDDCRERAEKEYKESNWYYSELLDEYYEYEDEMEQEEMNYKAGHWYYSEYDDEYYEDESDLTEWLSHFEDGSFKRETISYESICALIRSGEAVQDEETGICYSKTSLEEALAA